MKIITKIDEDTYSVVEASEPVILKISDLRHKINELRQLLNADEPTNQELIEYGKMYHPYYIDIPLIETEIRNYENMIDELKAINKNK